MRDRGACRLHVSGARPGSIASGGPHAE